jgi:hypothetical protein
LAFITVGFGGLQELAFISRWWRQDQRNAKFPKIPLADGHGLNKLKNCLGIVSAMPLKGE